MLLLELFVGLAAIYVGAAVVFLLLLSTPLALIGAAARRVDRREGRHLRWSASVEDVAKALVAEQAVSFRVAHRRALTSRELEFLFLPLSDIRHLSNRARGHRCRPVARLLGKHPSRLYHHAFGERARPGDEARRLRS